MDRNEGQDVKDLPLDDKKSKEKADEAVKELDEIPPPGTDPLHEGP
ncbi:MAG TPA: hypothetical protein VNT77_02550 [Allosphingosinicella sp.]|nr:hypothetical protein [Allosphingosinicella sp.]